MAKNKIEILMDMLASQREPQSFVVGFLGNATYERLKKKGVLESYLDENPLYRLEGRHGQNIQCLFVKKGQNEYINRTDKKAKKITQHIAFLEKNGFKVTKA